MPKNPRPISFAGVELDCTRHICAFFNSEEEEYRSLLPFIKDGLASGHRSIHIIGAERRKRHLERLATAGIDATEAQRKGQLELFVSTEAYLSNGLFDPDRMLETFERLAANSTGGTCPLNRFVCQMEWASQHPCCAHDLIEFEARANDIWCRRDDVVICVYDLTKFSGDVVMDLMRTHPMIIVGGILQQNPFFVPPQEFLKELQQRRVDRMRSPQKSG
jgi:hypothetical protein